MPRIDDPQEGDDLRRAIVGRDLSLVFTWVDDRWAHAIEAVDGDRPPRRLLASCEEDAPPADPPAPSRPVYQQLHFQPADDGCFAFLVGQSGHEHFSASVHFAEHDDGGTRIEFDIAGRHTRDPAGAPGLAPTYLVDLPLTDVEEASHRIVRWSALAPRGRLMVGPVEVVENPTIVLLSEAGRRRSLLQAYSPAEPIAGARRCRYRWTWEAPRDPTNP